VLWPQVIDAVAPTPVLAAGGIGSGRQIAAALAMGAQGVWTGSLWLTVEESEAPPAQLDSYLKATSEDTVRSRAWTGKPCRMLRNEWTDAWDDPANPKPLGMPLQGMVTMDAVRRTYRYASPESQKVAFNPVGQVVGQMNEVLSTRELIFKLVEEYVEATDRLERIAPR
jgi:NAD(P)H-dependent flavin oxidoreductase YrpB (nitropropane dioxygenase family)